MFKLFTWWNGVTPGGWFDITRRSDLVGTDDYGNKYYQDRKVSSEGRNRRYVMRYRDRPGGGVRITPRIKDVPDFRYGIDHGM